MKRACYVCKQEGMTVDREGICHRCWQDRKDAEGDSQD